MKHPVRALVLASLIVSIVSGPLAIAGASRARSTVDPPVNYNAYRGLPALYNLMQKVKSAQTLKAIPPNLISQLANEPNSTYFKNCLATSGPGVCIFGDAAAKTTLVLTGDSWGEEWVPGLDALGKLKHFKIVAYLRDGCNMATGTFYDVTIKGVDTSCAPFRTAVINDINLMTPRPAMVILSEARYWYNPNQTWASDATWANAVKTTISSIHHIQVAVTFGEALAGVGPGQCLSVNTTNVSNCNTPLSTQKTAAEFGIAGITAAHALPLGMRVFMCAATCPDVVASTLVHSDAYHESAAFSTLSAAALGQAIGCGATLGFVNPVTTALRASTSSAERSACAHYLVAHGEY